jgi:diguanylate cyclase (GGDEF)-like protein/PAS domain S-box-containing protein
MAAGSHPIWKSLSGAVVTVFDHDLRFVSAGGSGLDDIYLTAEMLVGHTIFEALPPDVAAQLEPLYRAVLSGQEASADVPFNGGLHELRLAPVYDLDGGIVGGMGYSTDVTVARQLDRTLRESEERFRVAFENGPIAKVHTSLDGRFEQVNQPMCLLTGYSVEHLRKITIADITYPPDIAADVTAMGRLVAHELASYTLDKRYLNAAGALVWVTESVALVFDADGCPVHFIRQIQDITDRKHQEHVLAEERRRLREAQTIGHHGWWEIDLETGEVTWSDTVFEMYGTDRESFGKDLPAAVACVHPDDRDRFAAAIETCARTGEALRVSYRVIRPYDGALRYFEARGQRLPQENAGLRLVGVATDVTEVTQQVRATVEARAAGAFQHAVISASPDIVYVYDFTTQATVWTNRSLTELLGYAGGDMDEIGRHVLTDIVPPEDRELFEAGLAAAGAALDGEVVQFNHRAWHADGTLRWFSQRSTPLHRDEGGCVTQLVLAMRDITDGMDLQTRMEYNSLHDDLTGLPNRALLIDRLNAALIRSMRDRREVAVLFCDLDGFKRVNDTAGHAAGDAVLLEIARRLQSVLREGDTVARVGGDEFVIIVEPWNRAGGGSTAGAGVGAERTLALHVAQRVAAAVRQPIDVNGVEHVISASVGITYGTLPPNGHAAPTTAEEVLQDADAAMYRAKGLGKDRFEVFQASMRTDLAERGRVEQVLRAALRLAANPAQDTAVSPAGQHSPVFAAAYQPVFDARSGGLVGFEALARLTDGDGLDIAPEVFISVAEDTGIIMPLGNLMLELACAQLATWRTQLPGLSNVTMAVNVSALQAQHDSLGDDVRRVLAANRLVASDLVLELTETALLQAGHSTIANLHVLRNEGVGIAIDDFGTGYASLRYLAMLPVSGVKVDKSFTVGLPGDATSRKIVFAVAALAADMDLTCVVEGVETDVQRAALPVGVQLQGWLTGRPGRPERLDLRDLVTHGVP